MQGYEKLKDMKEANDLVESLLKLQRQITNPTREGMIDALSSAQNVAHQEITTLERSQGDIYLMPWENFQYFELYRKLAQYQQGLYNYAVKRFGEETFKKLLRDLQRQNENNANDYNR